MDKKKSNFGDKLTETSKKLLFEIEGKRIRRELGIKSKKVLFMGNENMVDLSEMK